MDYQQTLTYLFESVPMFQQIGSAGYKEGLVNTCLLDHFFDHPHTHYKTIHIAGTNGKGSCSHTLAAILQSAGYKTGLYTSPHMKDFRERIRVDGTPADEEFIVKFVENYRNRFEPLYPSFFELTTAMAFKYFAEQEVDIAIIEVGMGGRLDCTNIISPVLSAITNIGFDHTQYLGDTLEKIAREKAGIIKAGIPVVIGETTPETKTIFTAIAAEVDAPIYFAEEEHLLISQTTAPQGGWIYQTVDYSDLYGELGGIYQIRNTNTLLSIIKKLVQLGLNLNENSIREGFGKVSELTGLTGRWQILGQSPMMVCDTGHNPDGIKYIVEQLKQQSYKRLHIIIGMVNDKDIRTVLSMLPTDAVYYFTKASIKRAMPETELQELAATFGLKGNAYPGVAEAVEAAKQNADKDDFIFIGGSTFIVADLLNQ